MIAIAKRNETRANAEAIHERFVEMLPAIRRQARVAFRGLPAEQRDDLIAETLANAFCAFARLVEKDKADLAYPTPLAKYAVAQVRSGRRVGSRLNVRDVSSPYAQQVRGLRMERLDRFDSRTGTWQELLVEDRHATPADVASSRIDFSDWLRSLPKRRKEIALHLATGETTQGAAKHFGVSPGRISQIRRELMEGWEAFHSSGALAELA